MVSLLLSLLILPTHATSARVLIDEGSKEIQIEGRVRVHCLSYKKSLGVKQKSCAKLHFRNKLEHYAFRRRSFLIKLSRNTLSLTDQTSKKRWVIYGGKFRLQGSFIWKSQSIKTLDVFSGKNGTHWVVQLPIDQYLQGVLSSEVPSSWPINALKAQAIASRTYFLWKKKERQSYYDVRSDHLDQVFKMRKNVPTQIRQAIRETANTVLSRGEGSYFPAYYHSDCGGQTNPEDKVWRRPRAINKKVADPLCRNARRNQWKYKISKAQLLKVVNQAYKIAKGVELVAVLPHRKKESRAFIVDLLFSNNQIKRINANEFRKILGYGKLKSTHFSVNSSGEELRFQGRGYGHGVGMCQWGAQRWAQKGQSYQQILRHYYPMAQLAKMESVEELSSQSVASSHGLEY